MNNAVDCQVAGSHPRGVGEARPLLQACALTKEFKLGPNTLRILDGVDLAIFESDFMAIQGSSGAGKSTLLHLFGLLDRPTSGQLLFEGRDLATLRDSERTALRATELAFVFQFYYLLPEFSALENVLMAATIARGRGRAPKSSSERRDRALMLLTRVGLKERVHHRPHQLSGGERQRVAIARALMNSPRLLLCDEPTGNLDSKTASGIHDLLRELNEGLGQTIVVVTHEAYMARVARRRLRMVDGKIAEELRGDPSGAA